MSTPRLTLLVRADQTGLGYQTKSYYDNLHPHKTVIIDISSLNGNPQHYGWYEDAHVIKGLPTDEQVESILDDTDVLLTAETAYNPRLFIRARERGVKTICVENPEFFDQFRYPDYPLSDVIILPSAWMEQEIRDFAEPRGTKVVQLHHPVDRSVYKYRHRTSGIPFHVNGKPAVNDRNGMWDFFKACPDGRLITQDGDTARQVRHLYRHSKVFTDIQDNTLLYEYGDILVLPRRYGGNCLPLNEALSSGCPVIMPNISPNSSFLPKEWLVTATLTDFFEPRGRVDIYTVDTEALRERVEWVRANIATESEKANKLADTISWETLRPEYERVIISVYEGWGKD